MSFHDWTRIISIKKAVILFVEQDDNLTWTFNYYSARNHHIYTIALKITEGRLGLPKTDMSKRRKVENPEKHKANVLKRYCRLITFSNTRAHAAPLFKILKFFTIYQMYTYHVLLFMYTNLNNVGPGVLFSFQMNMDVHSHFTRQHCRLHTAFCRTRTRQRTLHYQGPKIWNDLPHDMKTLRFSLF